MVTMCFEKCNPHRGDHFVFLNCYLKNFPHGSWWVSGRYPLSVMRKSLKKGQWFLCHVKPTGAGVTVFGSMLEYAIGPLFQ
jgi:hypothetical protein